MDAFILELYGLDENGNDQPERYLRLKMDGEIDIFSFTCSSDASLATQFADQSSLFRLGAVFASNEYMNENSSPVYAGFRVIKIKASNDLVDQNTCQNYTEILSEIISTANKFFAE